MSDLNNLMTAVNAVINHPEVQNVVFPTDGIETIDLNKCDDETFTSGNKELDEHLQALKSFLDKVAFTPTGYSVVVLYKYRALGYKVFFEPDIENKKTKLTFQSPQTNIFITYVKPYQTNSVLSVS